MKFSLGKPKPLIKLMTSVSTIAEASAFFARDAIEFGLYEIDQYKVDIRYTLQAGKSIAKPCTRAEVMIH